MSHWLLSGAVLLVLFELLWLLSLRLRDVSIVDLAWAPAQTLVATVVWWRAGASSSVATLVLVSAWIWATRLTVHLSLRARGRGEDRRYAAMRDEIGPGFGLRSAVTVFGLQAVLATLLAAALVIAVATELSWTPLALVGAGLWLVGFLIESIADYQLYRFGQSSDRKGQVLDRGLWRYSRHPNYFGEAVLHWGWGLIAASGGSWWVLLAPVLLTLLLLKVSGIALMESDIAERRPEYRDYIRRTSAFVPWPPRSRR